jgi:choline dehydrogenase
MVYFRGSKRDFDIWENEYGLDGWGYEDVLPFFKRFENNQAIYDSPVHGYNGPINISMLIYYSIMLRS